MILNHVIKKSQTFAIFPIWKTNEKIDISFIPSSIQDKVTKDLPYLEKPLKSKKYTADNEEVIVIFLGNLKSINEDIVRKYMSVSMRLIISNLTETCDLHFYPDQWNMENERCFYISCEALLLTDYAYNDLKSKKPVQFKPSTINLVIPGEVAAADSLAAKAENVKKGVFLARDLINGPANLVTIQYMEQVARDLGNDHNISVKIFDEKELEKMNMNLHLAVGRASVQSPSLAQLQYHHSDSAPTVCLVAKGVVFDSGGLDLKPVLTMDTMKGDMGGAAAVLGALKTVALLNLKVNLVVLIPLAENSIGGNAYRAGDVITGHKGVAVEIKNTDAEGRLILADALSYAETFNPEVTIDIATLTGGVVIALGTKITGAFFKDREIVPDFMASAESTGEAVWEMPLFEEYKEMLKSDIADICNLGSPARHASTIIAALFLSKFVDNKKWIHLDIAGPSHQDKKWNINPKGGIGVMVRTLVHYLENFNK